jgi:hypothetical protein
VDRRSGRLGGALPRAPGRVRRGKKVDVAAEIGADDTQKVISPLPTHNGVVHVEVPSMGTCNYLGSCPRVERCFVRGQNRGWVAGRGRNTLTACVNGAKVADDPATIRLAAHQEIALVYGPADH